MSSRREILAGIAALSGVGRPLAVAAGLPELRLDEPAANLAAYIKLRGDLRDAPVYDMVRGRVFGLVEGQAPRPLFKMVGGQRTHYRRVSGLEYRADSRYVGLLLDWQTEQPLERWANPYNGRECEVPVTRYGPAAARLLPDRMLPGTDKSAPLPGTRAWFVIGNVLHMVDQVLAPAPPAAQPDGDLMNFAGDWRLVADPAVTRVPSQLSFTAVENWRDWMQMEQAGSLWWHVAGVKLGGPGDYPAEVAARLRQHDPDFFDEGDE